MHREGIQEVLRNRRIDFAGPIRILGPTYSGSFDSLVPAVRLLKKEYPKDDIRIRSGGVTVGDAAVAAVTEITKEFPGTGISFASALRDNGDWINAAVQILLRVGIDGTSTAILSEGESLWRSQRPGDQQERSRASRPRGSHGSFEKRVDSRFSTRYF